MKLINKRNFEEKGIAICETSEKIVKYSCYVALIGTAVCCVSAGLVDYVKNK